MVMPITQSTMPQKLEGKPLLPFLCAGGRGEQREHLAPPKDSLSHCKNYGNAKFHLWSLWQLTPPTGLQDNVLEPNPYLTRWYFLEMYYSTLHRWSSVYYQEQLLIGKMLRTTHSSKFLDSHISAIDVAFEHNAKATFPQLISSSWFWSFIKIICNTFQVVKAKIVEI